MANISNPNQRMTRPTRPYIPQGALGNTIQRRRLGRDKGNNVTLVPWGTKLDKDADTITHERSGGPHGTGAKIHRQPQRSKRQER